MIALLRGVLDFVAEDAAIIDVGGVGYLVFCSQRTLDSMPPPGKAVRVLVETHVREDHIHLYGFLQPEERSWFRLLTTVQGVGARVALSILSVLSSDQLLTAIVAQDKAPINRAHGVGPKLAARVVSELKDKVGGMALSAPARICRKRGPIRRRRRAQRGKRCRRWSISAFPGREAFGAVARAGQSLGGAAGVDDLIKSGLKELAR